MMKYTYVTMNVVNNKMEYLVRNLEEDKSADTDGNILYCKRIGKPILYTVTADGKVANIEMDTEKDIEIYIFPYADVDDVKFRDFILSKGKYRTGDPLYTYDACLVTTDEVITNIISKLKRELFIKRREDIDNLTDMLDIVKTQLNIITNS